MSEEGRSVATGGIVLDFLPHGRVDDDRPQFKKQPLVQAMSPSSFQLFELVLESGESMGIGDSVPLDTSGDATMEVREIGYDELSGGARAELEHVVREQVQENEAEYVSFYNEAGPISLRLHQLNLLPGIGDKLRDNILETRKRSPFESFGDMEELVSGLHDPDEIVVERILDEIEDVDIKYRLFAREQ